MNTNNNTLFIGKVLLHVKELDSTNTYALNLLSKNKPSEGTVVSAWNQTKGRGQIGSSWESEPGKNITISIILYPIFLSVRQQFLLNEAVSLGVWQFISRFINRRVNIKWPNDILVGDKKIAGILIQNILSGNAIQTAVSGIGINVNQMTFAGDIPNPTSLKTETGNTYNIDGLIDLLCSDIEKRYLQLRSGNYPAIQQEYLEHLYRFREEALFQRSDNNQIFSGKITGVDDSGKILIDHKNGQSAFSLKEIRFV